MARRPRPCSRSRGRRRHRAVAAAGVQSGAAQAKPSRPKPTKVVIIVVDALSKEIVDKYDMDNVQALMADYVDTPRGYLGHTGSVTVVTHNVITSGQLPKHMGWTSEGYRDVDDVLDGADRRREPLHHQRLDSSQMFTLQQAARLPQARRLPRGGRPDRQAVHRQPQGVRRLRVRRARPPTRSSRSAAAAPAEQRSGHVSAQARRRQLPSYILGDCTQPVLGAQRLPGVRLRHHQAAGLLYPLDGDRYVTGHDAAHEGGDVWAADAAIEIMRNDPTGTASS